VGRVPDRQDEGPGNRYVLEKPSCSFDTSIVPDYQRDDENDLKKSKWDRLLRRWHTGTQQKPRVIALTLSASPAFLTNLNNLICYCTFGLRSQIVEILMDAED